MTVANYCYCSKTTVENRLEIKQTVLKSSGGKIDDFIVQGVKQTIFNRWGAKYFFQSLKGKQTPCPLGMCQVVRHRQNFSSLQQRKRELQLFVGCFNQSPDCLWMYHYYIKHFLRLLSKVIFKDGFKTTTMPAIIKISNRL